MSVSGVMCSCPISPYPCQKSFPCCFPHDEHSLRRAECIFSRHGKLAVFDCNKWDRIIYSIIRGLKSALGKVTSSMKMFQSTNDCSSFCAFYKDREDKEKVWGLRVDEREEQGSRRADSAGTWTRAASPSQSCKCPCGVRAGRNSV